MDKTLLNNVLHIISLDSEYLFNRVVKRKEEYLFILSSKRNREHFKDVFMTRYSTFEMGDLKNLPEKLVSAIFDFYEKIFDLRWYLLHSEDQPNVMRSHTDACIRDIEGSFYTMRDYIEKERSSSNSAPFFPPPFND